MKNEKNEFWSLSLEHFIECRPLISEECCIWSGPKTILLLLGNQQLTVSSIVHDTKSAAQRKKNFTHSLPRYTWGNTSTQKKETTSVKPSPIFDHELRLFQNMTYFWNTNPPQSSIIYHFSFGGKLPMFIIYLYTNRWFSICLSVCPHFLRIKISVTILTSPKPLKLGSPNFW